MNQAEQDAFKERNPVPERQLFESLDDVSEIDYSEFEPERELLDESNFSESNFSDMESSSDMMLV